MNLVLKEKYPLYTKLRSLISKRVGSVYVKDPEVTVCMPNFNSGHCLGTNIKQSESLD